MTTDPQTASVRLRTYLRLLPDAHTLGGEIAYSEEFRSEGWPRSCYAPTREDVEALLAVVPSAPVDRAELRDRIAGTVMPFLANFSDEEAAKVNAREVADAVLAVLPAPVDRAAVLAEMTAHITGMQGYPRLVLPEEIVAELRRGGDEEQQPETQAITRPTRYEANLVPEDDDLIGAYAITVEYRGDERWAVLRRTYCLSADGYWDRERVSSERDDEWLDAHRFDLDTALRLAEEQAADIAPAKWRGRGGKSQPCADAAVAQPGKEAQPIPCNAVHLRVHHAGHQWEPQPGMDRIPCAGYPAAAPQPEEA